MGATPDQAFWLSQGVLAIYWVLFASCDLRRYSLPMRQYMHQQPPHAPFSPNRSLRASQRSGVPGWIVSFCMCAIWGSPA